MTDLSKLSPAALKAAMTGGTAGWGEWGSSTEHQRYAEPFVSRRRCHCGCKGRVTHNGMTNGVTLMSGCELSVRRWIRDPLSAIRALSNSSPTPLQEQKANGGKEETASAACGNNVDESP